MWGGSGRLLEEVTVALGLENIVGVGQVVKGGGAQPPLPPQAEEGARTESQRGMFRTPEPPGAAGMLDCGFEKISHRLEGLLHTRLDKTLQDLNPA